MFNRLFAIVLLIVFCAAGAPERAIAQRVAPPPKALLSKQATTRPPGSGPLDPSPIPAFWTCVGNCGTDGADGVVTLSPAGNSAYEWVSTSGGAGGAGILPSGSLGSETNGSTLRTPVFSGTMGTNLSFFFNYVTSDGAGYADYAWAELYNSDNIPVALLFTARTETSGSIIPGLGMPAPLATLVPASVPIHPGGPSYPELGSYSGYCWDAGCGYTGWVRASYVIPATGNYYLKVGVVNWLDTLYDSALAVDGVTLGGVPITLLSGSLDVEYGTDTAKSSWLALTSASDSQGKPLNMKDAATQLGFDHFNWLQIITTDLQLQACAANPALGGCSSDFTMNGKVPAIPTADPPAGGYAYELCPAAETAVDGCQSAFPAQDYWAVYFDEYFAPVSASSNYYKASPGAPEYLQEFRAGNTLKLMGAINQSPATALGFSFSDAPNTSFVVPGTATTKESIVFVDALVGVKGSCNLLVSSNCSFQIIPGTTFTWTSTDGIVSPQLSPGGPGTSAVVSAALQGKASTGVKKQLNHFPVGPVDLTGAELASSLISVDQFLSMAGLTPDSLAAMGGSVATFSASLIPSQAAALAAVNAGTTLVSPGQLATTTSGLAYSRVSQTFNGTLTLKNVGKTAITGPLQVLFNGLPATVTLANGTGSLAGTPYLTAPVSSLAPGQSLTVAVQFKNSASTAINFEASIYSGSIH